MSHDIKTTPKAIEETKTLLSIASRDRLQHESKCDGGTSNAETSLEGGGSTRRLREMAGRGAPGGGGAERGGNGQDAGGLDDGVVVGQARAGDEGAGSLGGVRDGAGDDGLAGGGRGEDGTGDGVALLGLGGGSDAGNGVAGRSGAGSGGSRRDGAAILGDAELGRVLVEAGHIVDDLNAVAGRARGGVEGGSRGPDKGAAVGNALSERRTELDDVGGRALEEQHRDGVGGGRLPCDGEGLAGRDDLRHVVSEDLGVGPCNAAQHNRAATGQGRQQRHVEQRHVAQPDTAGVRIPRSKDG